MSLLEPRLVTILLVDDDDDVYLTVKHHLMMSPGIRYFLDWVSKYEDVMEIMSTHKYNFCLVDYRLYDVETKETKSGIDLIKNLKKIHPDCVFVMYSGDNDVELDIQSYNAGADFFLCKNDLGKNGILLERTIRYLTKIHLKSNIRDYYEI